MANTNPVKVAMIGVGKISGIYLKNITTVFKEVELVGVCDLIPERAEKGVQTVKEYIEAGEKSPQGRRTGYVHGRRHPDRTQGY